MGGEKSKVICQQGVCNMSVRWVVNMEKRNEKVKEQEWGNITVLGLKAPLTKFNKWKSPAIEKVPNFRLNALSLSHVTFYKCIE